MAAALVFSMAAAGFLFFSNRRLRQKNAVVSEKAEDVANQYQTICHAADAAIVFCDPETDKIVDFNPALGRLFGYQAEEIYYLTLDFIFSGDPPCTFENAKPIIADALDGTPLTVNWVARHASGRKLNLSIRLQKVAVAGKTRLLLFIRDISDRVKTESRLTRFMNIVDQIGEGVATADLNGTITYVNQAWADMHGYPVGKLVGQHLRIFHSDEQNAGEVTSINKKVLQKGYYRGEVGHQRADKTLFITQMTSTLQKDEKGRVVGFIAVATDLSEQKKVEAALRENEIKFRHLFNLSPQPIYLTDLNGGILDVNQKFCEKMRYSRHEVIGKNILDIGFPAEHRQTFTDLLIQNGEVSGYEIAYEIKSQEIIQAQLYAKLIQIKGQFVNLTVLYDVTARRKLEAQLVQSQKLEAIGTLAGGIAHDFNNILSGILGYVELARIYVEPDTKVFNYLDEVFKAGNRAKELVRQILSISRQAEQKRKPVDITTVAREALHMLEPTFSTAIDIQENLGDVPLFIEADPVQMHQVIMNLVTNAGQSMKRTGGQLMVSAEIVDLQTAVRKMGQEIAPGKYVCLTISDTGHGISREDQKRIFDPYYTTRAQGVGTGLGLAVAQSIVKKHGGNILFSTRRGKGTDFYIYLPMLQELPADSGDETAGAGDLLPGGDETVMLVDDEAAIIETGREMLEYLGYSVAAFDKSTLALQAFEASPDAFDLVISDMTMPDMNGDELVRKMMRVRSDIPVIICTGYNPGIDETAARKMGLKGFIFKPLTFQKLAVSVRKVLDGSGC